MPKFLTRFEVYRLLQRELPENVYPDGPASAFFSTADMDAIGAVAASGYANMERIYENYWPQSANEKIGDWELTVFNKNFEASLTLQQRRDKILEKIRSPKGITISDMIAVVKAVIGSTQLVEIREWGCTEGGWMIGESQLGIETILNGARLTDATGPDLCSQDWTDFGLTEAQWLIMREEAYTYEVLIYDYVLTTAERDQIDEDLSAAEPARSQHVITDNLDSDDMISGDT